MLVTDPHLAEQSKTCFLSLPNDVTRQTKETSYELDILTNANVWSRNVRIRQRKQVGEGQLEHTLSNHVKHFFFFFNVTLSLFLWLFCFHGKELAWVTTLCRLNKWAFIELCGSLQPRHDYNPKTLHGCCIGAKPKKTPPRISPLPSSTYLRAERLRTLNLQEGV